MRTNRRVHQPRLVLVHGFTQTARSWDPMAAHLPPTLEVHRPELPGHGAAADDRSGFAGAANRLAAEHGPATFAGYSMGGRVCLRLTLDHPAAVDSLVLFGASPGLASADERDARRRDDERLAADIAAIGVAGFLEMWMSQPMFETSTPRPHDVAARRQNPPEGLAHALRALGTGAMEPLWHRLPDLQPPTLLVVGEHDHKFRAIAETMDAATGPHVQVVVVAGAGHALPLDQPEACARLVVEHMGTHAPAS